MTELRFLLLEDSLLDTELIRTHLIEGGIACELLQVKTHTEFQSALEQGGFDLILSDYSLPGFDGISALEMAQNRCPDVPFVFVTATMGEELAIETLKNGATDYVLKQNLERLVPSVQRALREAEEIQARKQAEQALAASVAQLRQKTEELERANRLKDEFLAVLSHELRSPLNAILGWSQLLQSRKFEQATLTRALETIERNARLQTQLIEELLDISRIIQGKLALQPQPTSLTSVIEGATSTMRLAAETKLIDLQFTILDFRLGDIGGNSESVESNKQPDHQKSQLKTQKFQVMADPNRLQQIVWNLLSNAIKFTPSGGRVEIELSASQNYAQIQVRDTGIGIKPDFLPYVFDYFRQADASSTRNQGGLGLGLALARHLVELHGGTVCAESPGDGQGATFTLRLPLMQGSRDKGAARSLIGGSLRSELRKRGSRETLLPTPLAGLRVLVVDDQPDSRDFLVVTLEQYGAIATAADSASSALEALEQFKPDLLVSDIGMPGEDGYTLIRKVRLLPPEQGGEIPAIALSAYAGEKDRQEAILAGFQNHLPKPVMPDDIAATIAQLIGR